MRRSGWTLLALALAAAWFQPRAEAAEPPAPGRARASADAAREDPMDVLRQRLAERLGAQKPADARGANVMRVDNRAAGGNVAPGAVAAGNVAPGAVAAGNLAAGSAAAGSSAVRSAPTAAEPARPATRRQTPPPEPAAPHADIHWDYAGQGGPEAWGRLKPEYAKCGNGQRQSPIDIHGGIAVQLEPIQFDYRPSSFSVVDTGHTVQVNLLPGNTITVLGRHFDLLQFHFHRPSEELVNGRQHDMVIHLVHRDAEGKLAVVAVLLDRGAAQPIIQAVWNALPLEKNEPQAAPGTIDLAKLLPEDRRYYTYMGSLTTPPCTEGVLWMVMKTPVPVAPEQIDIFAHLYPMNARPVQGLAGRLIKESQ